VGETMPGANPSPAAAAARLGSLSCGSARMNVSPRSSRDRPVAGISRSSTAKTTARAASGRALRTREEHAPPRCTGLAGEARNAPRGGEAPGERSCAAALARRLGRASGRAHLPAKQAPAEQSERGGDQGDRHREGYQARDREARSERLEELEPADHQRRNSARHDEPRGEDDGHRARGRGAGCGSNPLPLFEFAAHRRHEEDRVVGHEAQEQDQDQRLDLLCHAEVGPLAPQASTRIATR
jgi:hypothetical protein